MWSCFEDLVSISGCLRCSFFIAKAFKDENFYVLLSKNVRSTIGEYIFFT